LKKVGALASRPAGSPASSRQRCGHHKPDYSLAGKLPATGRLAASAPTIHNESVGKIPDQLALDFHRELVDLLPDRLDGRLELFVQFPIVLHHVHDVIENKQDIGETVDNARLQWQSVPPLPQAA
jgi:hypothetical protein